MTNPLTLWSRLDRRLTHESAIRRFRDDFSALMASARTRHGNGKKIGFAAFGAGEWHLAFELILAHALQRREARPEFLLCDLPGLPICAERLFTSSSQQVCGGCIDVKRSLLDAAGMSWRGMSGLIGDRTMQRAQRIAGRLHGDEIENYVERGVPLGRWLHVSASNFLRSDARGDSDEKQSTRRRLLTTAIVGLHAVDRWLDQQAPDVVVVQGGAHVLPRIALERARARGIPVVSRELGKGGWDRQIFALNRDAMAPDLDAAWQTECTQALTAAEDAEVDLLSANLIADTYKPVEPTADVAALPIDPGRKVAVAFTNVTWDLATADRDVAFAGIYDWLTETMRALASHHGVQLIVRAHPAESSVITHERILDRLRAEWPPHPGVVLVSPEHPIGARDLFARADLVLAYNSTAGLEAAMNGKDVMLCGAPHFRGRGFTIDVDSRDQYRDILAGWATGSPLPRMPQARDLARRYFHLFFARYHIQMGWTTTPLEPPFQLRITSLDELEPGRNPSVDLVCDGIINAQQILRPRVIAETACAQ